MYFSSILLLIFVLINLIASDQDCGANNLYESIDKTKCYYVGIEPKSYDNALNDCRQIANANDFSTSFLSSIHSAFEQQQINGK